MMRRFGWLIGGLVVLAVMTTTAPAQAAGLADFKFTRAIPADAMLAAHFRSHDGLEFVEEQYARIWAAIEKQHFEKDLRRLLREAMKEGNGDVESFDEQWQQMTDLAAGVNWTGLASREFAFAMKVAPPFGADFVYLLMPEAETVADDFAGLSAILKHLVGMAPDDLVLATEGEGSSVTHVVSLAAQVVPLKLVVARHNDILLIGFGTSMADQALALLRGETDPATGTLASTDRFKQAFSKLPPPKDSLHFIDISQLMSQGRAFATMGADMFKAQTAMGEEETPEMSYDFLPKIVDALDIWEFVAGVSATDGMRTLSEEVTVLRTDANTRPLYRVLHGSGPMKEPLKYVPVEATDVSVTSGLDLLALYHETIKFIQSEVPGGEGLIAQWDGIKATIPLDIEQDLLGWMGGSFVTFSAPIPTPFLPGSVWILEVRDKEKANAALAQLSAMLNDVLMQQQGGVEDADLEGAEGFKRVILPPMFAMVPGLGRPIFGIKDGHLFLGNGPEVVEAALRAGAGEGERFSSNERYKAEGLPLTGEVVAFSFSDLSKLGEQLGQMLPAIAFMMRMAPEVSSNPAASAFLNALTKAGNVCKQLDFFKSSCSVTTFDGRAALAKSVVNYKEPPKASTSAGGSRLR